MKWPSPQDYREAIQNPSTCLSDEDLRGSQLELDSLQLPVVRSGQYAAVFKLQGTKTTWAVRCFLHNFADRSERYRKISNFVLTDALEYTVAFELIEKGIRIGSEWFPILKMEYVEGETLGRFLDKRSKSKEDLTVLLDSFQHMMLELKDAGIAHGDLQHDNIIVTPDHKLRLIDYDGMYVPELAGWDSNELGHRNYQHPARNSSHFSSSLDNFSAWVIKSTIECMLHGNVWERFHKSDESLLLTRKDYLEADHSQVFFDLENSCESNKNSIRKIRAILRNDPGSLPFIDQQIKLYNLPAVKVREPALKASSLNELSQEVKPRMVCGLDFTAYAKARTKTLPVFSVFPSAKLTRADANELISGVSAVKARAMEGIKRQLLTDEQIMWSGGLSPMKLSSTDQKPPTRVKMSTLLACGLAIGGMMLSNIFSWFVVLTIVAIVILALDQFFSSQGSLEHHELYALSEQRFFVVYRGSERGIPFDAPCWDICSCAIPVSSLQSANVYNSGDSDEIELVLKPDHRSGQLLKPIWLFGFTKSDRQSLLCCLRSLGIQCNEIARSA